jgi:hypothetical protein
MDTLGFPRPLKVGPRVVVWRLSDLEAWERGGRGDGLRNASSGSEL